MMRRVLVASLCAGILSTIGVASAHEEFLPPMPPPARPPGPTLATVNGAPVTLRDYEDAAKSLPADQRTRREILRKAIRLELLRQEAIRLGLDGDAALVRLRENIRDEYLKDQVVQREAQRAGSVTDAELRWYYEEHAGKGGASRPFDEVKGSVREAFIRERLRQRFDELYAEAERQGVVAYAEAAIRRLMAPPPDNPAPGVVLATVNGVAITVHDFGHVFFSLDRAGKEAARRDPRPTIRGLVVEELRRQEGLRLGLDRDPAFVQFLEQRTRGYLVQEVTRRVRARVAPIDDAAMRRYYEAHTDEFTADEEIVASHILLPNAEAARAVLAALKAGADFAALARERSEDPAARAEGGRLPTIRRGQTTPEVERAVFALSSGDVGVVEDRSGFHVIKVHYHSPAALRPFETVKGWLQYTLSVEAQQRATDEYFVELERLAAITIEDETLAKIEGPGR